MHVRVTVAICHCSQYACGLGWIPPEGRRGTRGFDILAKGNVDQLRARHRTLQLPSKLSKAQFPPASERAQKEHLFASRLLTKSSELAPGTEELPESVNELGLYLYLQRLAEFTGHGKEVPRLYSAPKGAEDRLAGHQEATR